MKLTNTLDTKNPARAETKNLKKSATSLKVKTNLKAGADSDPCSSIWYDGYYRGYEDAFGIPQASQVYY